MTDHAQSPSGHAPAGHASGAEGTRRDFLNLTAASVTAFGVASVAWPLISSLNPSKDVLALSSTEVDISQVAVGQAITVMWRGKPVFVRHRTETEIEQARKDDTADLKDPQTDESRVEKPEFLIMVGVCTHLGCIPLGQKDSDPKGEFGGWYCPCHGSQYDTSGRIRKGPAPTNLEVPAYQYLSDTVVRIG